MAMQGNKKPGSTYRDTEPFKGKGLVGGVEHTPEEMKLMEGTTILPTLNVSSDGSSSKATSKPGHTIDFDSSTDRGIETLYTGDRVGEGKTNMSGMSAQREKLSLSRPSMSMSVSDLVKNISSGTEMMSGLPTRPQQSRPRAQAFDSDNTILPEKKSPTEKVNVLTKKSGKNKVISNKRAERVKSTIARRTEKGKNIKRSVKSYDLPKFY